jgi:hypothetical protein
VIDLRSVPDSSAAGTSRSPWYRRRSVALGGAVLAVVAAAVIVDLPHQASHSTQVAGNASVISQLNADVQPCVYGVDQTFAIYRAQAHHSVPASDRGKLPDLLRDDQNACAFTNSSIYDLANMEVAGSTAGKHLNNIVSTVTLWASSDALGAIEAIQTLMSKPADRSALAALGRDEKLLASDRAEAEAQLKAADAALAATLPALVLPTLPRPPG